MTLVELKEWQANFRDGLMQDQEWKTVDGVAFKRDFINCIYYRYKKFWGLVWPDNGYNGGNSYFPLAKITFSFDSQVISQSKPNLEDIAKEIKKVWGRFIS